MRTNGLSFVMVGAPDVDRAVAFYRDDLGLPVQSRVRRDYVACANSSREQKLKTSPS